MINAINAVFILSILFLLIRIYFGIMIYEKKTNFFSILSKIFLWKAYGGSVLFPILMSGKYSKKKNII